MFRVNHLYKNKATFRYKLGSVKAYEKEGGFIFGWVGWKRLCLYENNYDDEIFSILSSARVNQRHFGGKMW